MNRQKGTKAVLSRTSRALAAGMVSIVIAGSGLTASPARAEPVADETPLKQITSVSAPKIAGAAKVGMTLTGKPDKKVSPADAAHTHQWLRNGRVIEGATDVTYQLTAADRGKKVSVRTCYTKAGYTTKCATSKTYKVGYGAFGGVSRPKIAGTRQVGQTLTAAADTSASPSASALAFAWFRNGKRISGATSAEYVLADADRGKAITVQVSYSAPGYRTKKILSSKTGKIAASTGDTPVVPGPADDQRAADSRALIAEVNKYRAANQKCGSTTLKGVAPVEYHAAVTRAADGFAHYLADNNKWTHYGPSGLKTPKDRVRKAGYKASSTGEVLAAGHSSVETAVEALMKSESHCRVIMSAKYKVAGGGIAYNQNSDWAWYIAIDFAA